MGWRVGQIILALLYLAIMVGLVFDIATLSGAGPLR